MRQRSVAPVLLLCGALAAAPVAAEVYTVTLTNGSTFESRYQPRQASWDATVIELLTETGNWIAMPKTLVSEVVAASESKGFGRVIDTTTIDLGFAPNDLPQETAGQATQLTPLEQAFNRNYDIQQFAEPNAVGGGLPVFGIGGTVGGGGGGGGFTPPSAAPSLPVPAPATPPPAEAPPQ
jgi:hypothetical protein